MASTMFYSAAVALLVVIATQTDVASAQTTHCIDGYHQLDNRCVKFSEDDGQTWQDAKVTCHLDEGFLAILDTCQFFGDVVARINAQGRDHHNFWVGGSDEAEENNWLWLNGDTIPMGVPYWGLVGGANSPNGGTHQNCLFLNTETRHYFDDEGCGKLYHYICETHPVHHVTPTPGSLY